MRAPLGWIAIALAAAAVISAQSPTREWVTRGFDAWRRGTFDASGANLYVSWNGTLQTIHHIDVNEDGFPDLIFNNTHDIAYMVPAYEYRFHGRANPDRREYPGPGSVRVRAADLNGDGRPELLIARGFDDTTRVMNSWIYWGVQQGWNVNQHAELFTPFAQDVCTGDFNHDGHVDIAFAASWTAGVHESLVYMGGGEPTKLDTPGATACLAADLDSDGTTDLAIAGVGDGAIVYWGGPKGLSAERSSSIEARGGLGAAFSGRRFVLATSHGPQVYSVHGRDFALEQTLPLEGAARVAIADLNRDGIPDLAVARTTLQHNWEVPSRIYWGRQRGGSAYAEIDFTELPTHGAADIAIADLDQDGYPDLVFANSRSYTSFDVASYVYWGGPDGYSASRRTELPTHGAVAVTASETSVYFANANRGGPIGKLNAYVYLGNAQGSYSPARRLELPTIGGYESCVADLDDDGHPDIVLLGSHEGDPEGPAPSTIYWGGSEGFSPSRTSPIPTRGAIGCAIGEVNQDGFLDLVFTNMDDGTVALFPGGSDRFAHPKEQTLHVRAPRFPAIADLNRDGYPDLLVPSVDDGLWIFWGARGGYRQEHHTVLPGTGTVSEQIADLNHDGYLDLIICNLLDPKHGRYHGINTYLYWGSANGYEATNRTELPSLGAHHAVVEDFNRDGALDIFISNYQSEFTRDLDSFIYWGNAAGEYAVERRTALHVGSAAGVVAADLDADGWIDLAVANHVSEGDHHAQSPIFWNGPNGFFTRPTTWLPTIGPHMMSAVDVGNLYTRGPTESYQSAGYDCEGGCVPAEFAWDGKTPFQSFLSLELRGADRAEQLEHSQWREICSRCAFEGKIAAGERHRWWQYRAVLHTAAGWGPQIRAIKIRFR
jgi:hypothetical protein